MAFLWGSDMGSQTFVGDELPQQEAASFIDLIYETATGPAWRSRGATKLPPPQLPREALVIVPELCDALCI